MTLPAVSIDPTKITSTELDEEGKKVNPLTSITMRVVDAMSRKNNKQEAHAPQEQGLEDMMHEGFETARAADHESPFPHVAPKKRKVSLDGRKIAGESKAEVEKPVSFETVAKSAPKAEKPAKAPKAPVENFEVAAETVLPNDKLFAPTLEITVPPNVVDVSIVPEIAETEKTVAQSAVAVSPVVQSTQDEPISKELQSITGPQVEVKVMSFQVSDGMLEAQPAAQAIAQAATVTGDVISHVDADCSIDPKVGQTILDRESIGEDDDDDVEQAEEYDGELETDAMDIHMSAAGGPTTLYLRQNLRSGQTVSHKGHLVIIGDINPGAEVMADGDITVWGCLRGVAHAGIGGNVDAEIRALKLQPIQIRIAHAIARAPDRPRVNYAASNGPETARMVDGKSKSSDRDSISHTKDSLLVTKAPLSHR